ncbi:phage tail tape measure protein [Corynebacterium phocae]|uniref:phage tail tape measure protein n=1 Tax=Corynebacterium phocae TaxID=161895 RepID=UPI0009519DEC|nr:phage tail tape measure protein [Corynebacterium phocae]KAA8723581.1 hypothetical protein F4V58_06565 [Corynebacterium phocae]
MSAGDVSYIPVLPSFDGFFKETAKQSKTAGKAAGKNFGAGVEKGAERAKKAVESASSAQERAHNRAANAADKTRVAQAKLAEVLDDENAKASDLARATAGLNKAVRDEEQAAKAARRADEKLARAQSDLKLATDDLGDAMDLAEGDVSKFGRTSKSVAGDVEDLARSTESLDGAAGKVAQFVGAFAGISAVAGGFTLGADMAGQLSRVRNQLGYVGADAEILAEGVSSVMRSGVASSAEEAAQAVGALESQFDDLGAAGADSAAELADNFIGFSRTFDVDIAEAAQTAGQLITNGLATDVENAADLMTAAMQRVPAQMRDELPEIINEYGTNFRALGFDGEEAFGLLVSAAGKGKWALDKTGDALKEFTIRGSDMSKNSVAAYEAVGLNAEEMSNKIATGGDGARDALQQVADGILGIEDPAERANTAIALFGTPLEDLSVDQIPQFLESLSGADGAMADFAGSSQQVADNIANSLQGRLDLLKGTVTDLAGEGFMKLWDVVNDRVIPALQDFGDWVQRNEAWVGPFAAAIGAAAGAWALWTGAIKAWQTAVKIATGLQVAFNLVMNANPVLLAVTAIAALVAGLVYFFTQTELGQELWAKFTDSLGAAWDWVKKKLVVGFAVVRKGWDIFTAAIQAGWEKYISPALSAIGNAFKALWENYISPVIGWIVDKWDWYTDRVRKNIEWITGVLFPALSGGITALWEKYFSPVIGWIVDKWEVLRLAMDAGRAFIVDTVFGGVKRGLQAMGDFFGSVVDGIRVVWNGLRSILAKPINFMINTVYNSGILRAWNTIAGILPGLDKGNPLSGIPEHATGGRISGPGTGTSDDVLMWGSNGEHMLTAAEVRRLGGHGAVYALREAVESGRGFTFDGQKLALLPSNVDNRAGDLLGAAPELFPKYAKGGEIRPLWEGQLMRAHEWAKSRHGRPYVLGGSAEGGGGTDCSGFMSGIADVIQGGDGRRKWATMAFNGGGNKQFPTGPQGFVAGLGPGFSIGVTNGGAAGGHTAGTLGPAGRFGSVNVEAGGAHPSMVKYGGGAAAGADGSYFRTRYHLPIGADGAFVSGGGGGVSPEVMEGVIAKKLGGVIDRVMNPIVDRLPSPPPEWQGVPRGVYERGRDGLTGLVSESVGKIGDKLATVYSAVSGAKDLVTDVAGKVWDAALSGIGLRDTGGMVGHGQIVTNQSGRPEYMLDPDTTVGFVKFVNQLPALVRGMATAADIPGAWIDAADKFGAAAAGEFSEQLPGLRSESESWALGQADAGLGLVGLGGLLDLGMAVANFADWGMIANELQYGPAPVDTPGDAAAAAGLPVSSPVAVPATVAAQSSPAVSASDSAAAPGGEVIIYASSDDDFVRVGDLAEVEGRVVKLERGREKPAAVRTRGGAF